MKVIKKVLVAVLVIAALFWLYSVLHEYGTQQRGYEAYGGEMFVFLLPLLVYIGVDTWKECKEANELIDDEEAEND